MLGAIKLPSSGVSKNKFFNGRYPMSRLLGPTLWKFVVLPKSSKLIKHYDMVKESSTSGLITASTVIENLNTLNEHHLLIFCNRVIIIASG